MESVVVANAVENLAHLRAETGTATFKNSSRNAHLGVFKRKPSPITLGSRDSTIYNKRHQAEASGEGKHLVVSTNSVERETTSLAVHEPVASWAGTVKAFAKKVAKLRENKINLVSRIYPGKDLTGRYLV